MVGGVRGKEVKTVTRGRGGGERTGDVIAGFVCAWDGIYHDDDDDIDEWMGNGVAAIQSGALAYGCGCCIISYHISYYTIQIWVYST